MFNISTPVAMCIRVVFLHTQPQPIQSNVGVETNSDNDDWLNSITDSDLQPVAVPSFTTLNTDDGELYSVPATMDERDVKFAIETQAKKKDKNGFFGKIEVFNDAAMNVLFPGLGTINKAFPAVGEKVENSVKSLGRGFLSMGENVTDTAIHYFGDVPELTRDAKGEEKGTFATVMDYVGTPDMVARNISKNISKFLKPKQVQEEGQKKLEWINRLRDKNKAFWSSIKETVMPEAEMDDMSRFFEGLGNGVASVGASMATFMATKNPVLASSIVATAFGRMRYTEVFDKSVEEHFSVDDADMYATAAGAIEGSIEAVGDYLLAGIAKVPAVNRISDAVLTKLITRLGRNKAGKETIKKIASRHENSVFGAAAKGFVTEGLEEGSQELSGKSLENWIGLENYSGEEILKQTMFALAVGGVVGGGAGSIGTASYNRNVRQVNSRLKEAVLQENPELSQQENQVMADALQEILYQSSNEYIQAMNEVVNKEFDPDTAVSGIDAKSIS